MGMLKNPVLRRTNWNRPSGAYATIGAANMVNTAITVVVRRPMRIKLRSSISGRNHGLYRSWQNSVAELFSTEL